MTPDERTQDMSTTTETPGPDEVTDERAQMLALHAIYVQHGYSDPERERLRAEADIAKGGTIDWAAMKAEVDAALMATVKALPDVAPEPAKKGKKGKGKKAPAAAAPQRVDVSAVRMNIDQGEALRERIKDMTRELKIHEDMVKDALGESTVGTDSHGHVLVRYPFRNRSGLSKDKVKEILTAEQYAACETVTPYRSLYYGESESR
jgi:hypothetical protein